MGLSFLDDATALPAMGVFSEYSFLAPVRSENPQDVRSAIWVARIGIFGHPKCTHMDEGG